MSNESHQFVKVAKEFIAPEDIQAFFLRLSQEVKTEDPTIKELLNSIQEIIKPKIPPPLWLWVSFFLLVTIHYILVIGVALSFLILPFFAPWFIALPLMVFIFFFSTTRIECKLTNLENDMRRKLGMKPIGGFVGHYFKRPIKRMIMKRQISRRKPR